MNGDFPRLTVAQRRLVEDLVNGKRVHWTIARARPHLDGRHFAARTLTRLIALGLVHKVDDLRTPAGDAYARVYGPTQRALEHFKPSPAAEVPAAAPAAP